MSRVVKVNRRQLLLGGLGLGVAATLARDFNTKKNESRLRSLAESQLNEDPNQLLQATFNSDAKKIYQGQTLIRQTKLTAPTLPYDRQISKLLIQCSKIATQQYLTGKVIPSYDGSISKLPAYSEILAGYKQIASFQGKEMATSQKVELQIPDPRWIADDPLEESLNEMGKSLINSTIKQAVKVRREIPVYLGFVLSCPKHNIIVFRGTQTGSEWINNLAAIEMPYTDPVSLKYFGKVHEGFMRNYLKIVKPLPRDIAKQLDPSLPCYITGHSLGASLAVICALDLALNVPKLRPNLRLYTYASPRAGDATFAKLHSKMIPNSYRIVNLCDTFTLVPPTKGLGTFLHVGQQWSFLSPQGDIMPNHVVDTYRDAVEKQMEKQTPEIFTANFS
ncbi:MAG: lipase [Cyanobacteriota bacterium ELA615]